MTMSAHAVLSSPNDGAWWRELQRTLGRASDMFIVLLTQTIKTRVFFILYKVKPCRACIVTEKVLRGPLSTEK